MSVRTVYLKVIVDLSLERYVGFRWIEKKKIVFSLLMRPREPDRQRLQTVQRPEKFRKEIVSFGWSTEFGGYNEK
jgi:hypothetical protein